MAFHQYKITFNADKDRYIIKGRTFDAVRDTPLEEYYENIVRNTGMPEAIVGALSAVDKNNKNKK